MHTMNQHEKIEQLKKKAAQAREFILETVHHANAGHVGGPMSATDMLIALYFELIWTNRFGKTVTALFFPRGIQL